MPLSATETAGLVGAVLAIGMLAEKLYNKLSTQTAPVVTQAVPQSHSPTQAPPDCKVHVQRMDHLEKRQEDFEKKIEDLDNRGRNSELQVIADLRELKTIIRERTGPTGTTGPSRGRGV